MEQTMWKASYEDSLFLKKITEKLLKPQPSNLTRGSRQEKIPLVFPFFSPGTVPRATLATLRVCCSYSNTG